MKADKLLLLLKLHFKKQLTIWAEIQATIWNYFQWALHCTSFACILIITNREEKKKKKKRIMSS